MFLHHWTETVSEFDGFFVINASIFWDRNEQKCGRQCIWVFKKTVNLKRTCVGFCNLLILQLETLLNLHSLGDPWSIVPYASLRLRLKRAGQANEAHI